MLLSLENITKSFGANLILSNITARVEDNDKIGLVGPNGAGKSTLLNIICGDLEPDEGTLARADKSFGFLRQSSGLDNENTILSEMCGVFSHLYSLQREMRELEAQVAVAADDVYELLAVRYAALQTQFESRDGYLIDVKINTVLNGMGFLGVDRQTPIQVLSSGEKTRLALCKLLLEAPDLLILDEPTNHLDFKTLFWLEEYLAGCKSALLVVSHDRYFLDRLCGTIWSIDRGRLEVYPGNYTRYVELREAREDRQRKEYDAQQVEIAQMKDFIARNIVRASTTARAQSRQKALDKMELVEKPRPPRRPAKIRFTYKREPVKDVLVVENLGLSVGESEERKQLCERVDFSLTRGEKVALIGLNGVGKSTFLKALQGKAPIDRGDVYWGKNTDVSYFEQEDFAFTAGKSTLDELWDRFPREYEHTIRTVLGNVGLTGENVYKRVGDLSGGERAKLKLALLILSCGNVLLMDEPTNHLDTAAKEALDTALCEYAGTLLVVSHDRYLLNKFPDKIAEMYPDRIAVYKGNYDRYMQQKRGEADAGPPAVPNAAPRTEKPPGQYRTKKQRSADAARKKRIAELEDEIEALEVAVFSLENETADPETAKDYQLLQQKCDALAEARLELSDRLNEWTLLCEQSE